MKKASLLFLYCALCFSFCSYGQEEGDQLLIQGKRYLDINIRSQEKYDRRVSVQQDRLLKKLKRKEEKFASTLKKKDSASYVRYSQQQLSYDSIGKLRSSDTSGILKHTSRQSTKNIDSLKKISRFVADKSKLNNGSSGQGLPGYDERLNRLTDEQSRNNAVNDLIQQRTNNLKNVQNGSKVKVRGLTSIQKEVFYAKSKMTAFKQMEDEPSKLEEKALEYLQGSEGFENYLSSSTPSLAGKNVGELGSMGIQTKTQVMGQLKERFGDLSGLQSNMGSQVKQFDKHVKGISEIKNHIANAKQTKQSLGQLRNTEKPAFKVNPMKGLPFSKRIEKQFNWQTTRATNDGRPAIFHAAAMVGFRHTKSLSYGLGLAPVIGLGQNWNSLKFTFEGLGLRSFAEWGWQHGFGAYAGYERTFRLIAFSPDAKQLSQFESGPHNTNYYSDAALIGFTKSYKLNAKWKGVIQALYDVWWRDKQMRSPIQIRISTGKI